MKGKILLATAALTAGAIWPARIHELALTYIQPKINTTLQSDIITTPNGWTSIDQPLEDNKISLKQYQDYLAYDDVLVRTYSRNEGREQFTVYIGYWKPGKLSIGGVGGHTPMACFAGSNGKALFSFPSVSFSEKNKKFKEMEHDYFTFTDKEIPNLEVIYEHFVDKKPYARGTPQQFRGEFKLERLARFGVNYRHKQYALRIMTRESFNDYKNDPGFQEVLESISKRIDK